MATSVYAASSIHSKSTLSKKYDVDVSAMFQGSGNFGGSGEQSDGSEFGALTQAFTIGIGRLDLPYSWLNTLKLWIYPFFVIVNCLGTTLMEIEKMDSLAQLIFRILKYITIWVPEDAPFMIGLSVCIGFLICYVSFVIFLFWLLRSYRQSNCPSFVQICTFLVISRLVLPTVATFVGHLFASSLYGLIFMRDERATNIAYFLCSVPLVLAQILIKVFECSVYNATPLIRKNDKSQLWFSYSNMDWQTTIAFFAQILVTYICRIISNPWRVFVYFILITVMYLTLAVSGVVWLPFIYPQANAIMTFTCFSMPFCALMPMISYFAVQYVTYALLAVILLITVMFFVARCVVGARMKKIMDNFNKIQSEDQDDENIDAVAAAMLQINPTRGIDFAKLNLKTEKEMSLYLRVGFLFNQKEVLNGLYIKWATDQNIKADLVLSACQVSYAIQSESRLMTTLEQYCYKLGSAPFNTKSFVMLYNHLRQELLTQLNKPLLEATERAKKADQSLHMVMSEFWSAVLKQRTDSLVVLVPQIAKDMRRTERAFQQLIRDYPRSPTVHREASIFYHKSLGDHVRSLACQNMSNKVRAQTYGEGSGSSDTMSSFSNVDIEFKDRMDPWLAAQASVQARSSLSRGCLFAALTIIVVVILFTPTIVLALSIDAIRSFQVVLMPIQTVGNILYDVSRIPQLARRMQLQVSKEVRAAGPAVGTPINALFEFSDAAAINASLTKYQNRLAEGISEFHDLCFNDVIYDLCRNNSVEIVTGSGSTYSTIYDTLLQYSENLAYMLSTEQTFPWATADKTLQLQYMFQNFNSLYYKVDGLLGVLVNEIDKYKGSFANLSLASILWTWLTLLVIIAPSLAISLSLMSREIRFNVRLLYCIPKSDIAQLKWSTKKQNITQTGPMNNTLTARSEGSMSSASSTQFRTNEMAETLATVAMRRTGSICTFVMAVLALSLFTCVMTTIGVSVFRLSMGSVIEMSSAYVSSIEVSSIAVGSYVWTQEVWAATPLLFTRDQVKGYSQIFVKLFEQQFRSFLYCTSNHSGPVLLLGDDVVSLFLVSNKSNTVTVSQYEPLYGILHDVYVNMSSEIQIQLLDRISRFSLATGADGMTFTFNDDFVYHYEHLLFGHIDSYLMNARSFFSTRTADLNQGRVYQLIFIYVITIVTQIIFFATIVVSEFKKLLLGLCTTKRLLQLVPPEALLKSQTVVKWLSGTYAMKSRTYSSESLSVKLTGDFAVEYSRCGILVMDERSVIVRVSSVAASLLGMTEEQLVGMKYARLIETIYTNVGKGYVVHGLKKQIKAMRQGFAISNSCVTNVSFTGLDGRRTYLSLRLEGQGNDVPVEVDDHDSIAPVHSFTCCIVDRTSEYQQEVALENEKRKTENLMRSVIPGPIVERLTQENEDVAYEASKVSIAVCSVSNWGKLMSSQTSDSLLQLLSAFFAEVDKELDGQKDAIKVKSMGPLYVIVVGLFSDSSVNTAQVAADLGFNIIKVAERVAAEIEVDFQVGIGINTGGPAGCGIVGKVRPTFEVFGPVVDVAMRMVFNSMAGAVQITEHAYEEIKYLKYNIKERTDVNIRGKGYSKIYTVTPADAPF